MKKVWRCSLCKQMCSRRENLKRHSERLHGGQGMPILQYIAGNSIVTPDETSLSDSVIVLADGYAEKRRPKTPILQPYKPHIQSGYNWEDKWLERILKLMEFQSHMNSFNQSRYPNQPTYFPHQYAPPHNNLSSNPVYFRTEITSSKQDNNLRNYDGVTGFKVDICLSCLTILSMPIGSKDISLQEIHKCTSGMENAIGRLGPDEYALDLRRILDMFPELLFNECKEWANSTGGRIYIIARKIEASDKSETQNDTTLVNYDTLDNYDALPFLNKILAQSKMIANDRELYEFLKLARNQTKAVITLRGGPGQKNLKYMLAVTAV